MRGTRHTMLTLTTMGAAVVATLLPGGCSSGGSGCAAQDVTVQNVVLSSISAAFDVHTQVRSHSDGKPLYGESVQFWAWGRPPGQSNTVSIQLGTVTSDASGEATLKMPPIMQNYMVSTLDGISGTDFVKVTANGLPGTVAGIGYCEGKGSAPVSCGPTGQACPVIEVPRSK
ncbi:MAG TPA: hypothetical protein VFN97_22010 [Actinospica sp.]|nr:hypothetical protein [Actinospica sp.]